MRVLYSGGGTLGPVSPLLGVHEYLKGQPGYEGIWVGLGGEREQAIVDGRGFRLFTIREARLRRTEQDRFSLFTLLFPARLSGAVLDALRIIRDTKPDVHLTAGSFVSGPVAVAAWLSGVPTVVHQQDILPGLANTTMAQMAARVTVSFPELLPTFGSKAVFTGNPVRPEILHGDRARGFSRFHFREGVPTILVVGGSSGAVGLNALIQEALPGLTELGQVLHMTGHEAEERERYCARTFLGSEEMADAYAIADVIIARAGLSTMTEISAIGRPVLFVPIPNSHQENNARYFTEKGASRSLAQSAGASALVASITELLRGGALGEQMKHAQASLFPRDAAERLSEVLSSVAGRR